MSRIPPLPGSYNAARIFPGQELFQWIDADGERHGVDSADVNEYLREASGGPFTAKDFRTWFATVEALQALRKRPVGNKGEVKKELVETIAAVAKRLGNTPTICRKCYIHPEVLTAFADGRLARLNGAKPAVALRGLLRRRSMTATVEGLPEASLASSRVSELLRIDAPDDTLKPFPADSGSLLRSRMMPLALMQHPKGRTMSPRLIGFIPATALVCGLAGGCATQGPQPTEEMTRARTLIEQADRSGAQRYAAADLQKAHDELSNADRANADKKYDDARRYAESAAADADVATARAAAGDAQRAAHEVAQSNETLRQESARGSTSRTRTDISKENPNEEVANCWSGHGRSRRLCASASAAQ